MTFNRRKFVAGVGIALGAAGYGSAVLADDSVTVEIVEVFPDENVIILENTGDEAVDLSGYTMDWEYENEQNQTGTIPKGTTIGLGQQLSVWIGFQSTQIPNVEVDVQLDEHGNGRISASEVDVIALFSPSGTVIDQTKDTVDDGQRYADSEDPAEPSDGDVTLDRTTGVKDEYENRDEFEIPVECPDCADLHNIDAIEIEHATPSSISGVTSLTQDCSGGDYDVTLSLNDSLSGSVPVQLDCFKEATIEFEFRPAEPLEPGEYEVTVSVGYGHSSEEEQNSFQISEMSDDPADPGDNSDGDPPDGDDNGNDTSDDGGDTHEDDESVDVDDSHDISDNGDDTGDNEGKDNGDETVSGSDDTGGNDDDLDSDDNWDSDDSDDQSEKDDKTTESGDNNDDTGGDDESTPGFTTSAGLVSSALGLEWLRRRASTSEREFKDFS